MTVPRILPVSGLGSIPDLADDDLAIVEDVSRTKTRNVSIAALRTKMQEGAALEATVRPFHASIVTPSAGSSSPGKTPAPTPAGSMLLLAFTIGTDQAHRQFKIPSYFAGNPNVHVHWSKTSDAVETGKAVRWRVSYTVFNGSSEDGGGVPTVVELEDTYDDAGTTTRVVHRTANVALAGFVAGYYVSMAIEAIAPTGAALSSEPGLFTLDLTFDETINV